MLYKLAVSSFEGEHCANVVQQFDAKTRAVRDLDVAIFDGKRLLHFFVQTAVTLVVHRIFLNLKVGDAGIQLQAGCGGNRPKRVVRDNVDGLCLSQSSNFFASRDAACNAHIRAHIAHMGGSHKLVELHQIDKAFARGNR